MKRLVVYLNGVRLGILSHTAEPASAYDLDWLASGKDRRLAPLYDQVCTLGWPELSKRLSMKVGTAGTLAEVSPENLKQLATSACLNWPMVRERLTDMAERVVKTCRQQDGSP